ncbi:hypothetical protein [Streptomyces sp. NPDC014894]|uniref:hypothetical protein n=1 Tax=Streptomyces sp. NPDC014894 TaxID=3364931 RepID=UPI0036FBA5F1
MIASPILDGPPTLFTQDSGSEVIEVPDAASARRAVRRVKREGADFVKGQEIRRELARVRLDPREPSSLARYRSWFRQVHPLEHKAVRTYGPASARRLFDRLAERGTAAVPTGCWPRRRQPPPGCWGWRATARIW